MTIEKLPSGSWRIKKMYKGKTYRLTVDYKPTKKEAELLIADKIREAPEEEKKNRKSFETYADSYIDLKKNTLSPRTVREYRNTVKRIPKWFSIMCLDEIGNEDIQQCISELSATLSPKTVRNYNAFISSVFGLFRSDMKICITLPQKRKIEPYIPTEEDVIRILNESQNTMFHTALCFACLGLRRGEILALTIDDFDFKKGIVHITKDMVMDEDGKWVIKPPKTPASVRDIPVPANLLKEVKKQGYVYNGSPNSITCYLAKIQAKLGIEHFSLHKLRHYFASKIIDAGYSVKDAQAMGGWQDISTCQNIYQHSLKAKQEDTRRAMIDTITGSLF